METPNLEYIKSISGGDTAFEDKLITIIKTEFVTEKETYFRYLKLKDYEQMWKLVHKIKHKIGILNLKQSHGIAVQYEEDLKNKETDLEENFNQILESISVFLKTVN